MSVCNFTMAADRLQILTDTLCYVDKRPAAYMRKVKVNEAAGLAIVTRGKVSLGDIISNAVMRLSTAENAVGILAAAFDRITDGMIGGPGRGEEATLFGFDDGQPFAIRFSRPYGEQVMRYSLTPGTYLAPTLGDHPLPAAVTVEQMQRLALVQQQVSKKHGLSMCIGGEMELTTITADGIAVETLGEYADKALTDRQVQAFQRRAGADRVELAA